MQRPMILSNAVDRQLVLFRLVGFVLAAKWLDGLDRLEHVVK